MATALLQIKTGKTSLTKGKATYNKVRTVLKPGEEVASVTPTVLNQQLMEDNRNSWCFLDYQNAVDSKGNPLKAYTWYFVNRKEGTLKKISEKKVDKLEWHERLYVWPSTLDAIKEKRSLVLGIGYVYNHCSGDELGLYGVYGDGDAARVAQIETSREAAAQTPKSELLRKFDVKLEEVSRGLEELRQMARRLKE